MATVLIGGDLCPIGRAESLFKEAATDAIFGSLGKSFREADLSLANLECCLISKATPIVKNGPVLGVETGCVKGLVDAGIALVNLANNHCMDHGPEGLRSTFETLTQHGVGFFGAGQDLAEARRIKVVEVDGMSVGLCGVAEHEFSIAGPYSYGANPFSPVEFVRSMRLMKEKPDFLFVLFHGGKEHYPYPTPRLMDSCRFMIEEGADAVVCQHSHCPGCVEIYRERPIVYGQGNLVFDVPGKRQHWYEGFVVQLSIEKGKAPEIELLPYAQFKKNAGIRLLQGEAFDEFDRELNKRSENLKAPDFVQNHWSKFCKRERNTHLSLLYGHNRLLRVLNRKFGWSDWLYGTDKKLMIRNVVECESHREVLETIWREGLDS